MGIGVVLGPALMVVATALAPATGQAGAAVPREGAAEVGIGQVAGPDVVGTASFDICCILPNVGRN